MQEAWFNFMTQLFYTAMAESYAVVELGDFDTGSWPVDGRLGPIAFEIAKLMHDGKNKRSAIRRAARVADETVKQQATGIGGEAEASATTDFRF